MNIAEVTIIASPADYVKGGNAGRHLRVSREDVAVQDIAPEIRARSRHVARRAQKRQSGCLPCA